MLLDKVWVKFRNDRLIGARQSQHHQPSLNLDLKYSWGQYFDEGWTFKARAEIVDLTYKA